MTLSILMAGARGQTRQVLLDQLAVDISPEAPKLLAAITDGQSSDGATVHVANALFPSHDFALVQAYRQLIEQQFAAEILPVALDGGAAAFINEWVRAKTRDKIKSLLGEGQVGERERLVVVNAVYFFAKWRCAFMKSLTRNGEFHTPSETVMVKHMHKVESLPLKRHAHLPCASLVLPMRNMDFVVTLPDRGQFEYVLEKFSAQQLDDGFVECEVQLSLPKFSFEAKCELSEVLSEFGLGVLFQEGECNLAGVTTDPRGLHVSQLVHEAHVDVAEDGVEAVAATAAIETLSADFPDPTLPVPFIVDRPFLFFIREPGTRAILFAGCVFDPRKK